MVLSDFRTGLEFWMSGHKWLCTDVGSRTVIAIKLDPDLIRMDSTWFGDPPYAVLEHVIDECSLLACRLEPEQNL